MSRFAHIERGDAGAPVVLCLHGFPDHAPSFEPLLDRLAAAGYRAVAPWMRGYAPSPVDGPYDTDQLARDVIEMAGDFSPAAPVHLVGHDWGAVATYAALLAAPERFRRAVAMSVPRLPTLFRALLRDRAQRRRSWYIYFFQLPLVPELVLPRDDFALVDRLWRTWSPGFELPDADRAALHACLAASMPAPIAYYRAMTRPLRAAPARLRPPTDAITVPTLYLTGERDGCIGPEVGRGQERFFAGPFASRVLPDVGHFMQLENPDAVAGHIIDWLGS